MFNLIHLKSKTKMGNTLFQSHPYCILHVNRMTYIFSWPAQYLQIIRSVLIAWLKW